MLAKRKTWRKSSHTICMSFLAKWYMKGWGNERIFEINTCVFIFEQVIQGGEDAEGQEIDSIHLVHSDKYKSHKYSCKIISQEAAIRELAAPLYFNCILPIFHLYPIKEW